MAAPGTLYLDTAQAYGQGIQLFFQLESNADSGSWQYYHMSNSRNNNQQVPWGAYYGDTVYKNQNANLTLDQINNGTLAEKQQYYQHILPNITSSETTGLDFFLHGQPYPNGANWTKTGLNWIKDDTSNLYLSKLSPANVKGIFSSKVPTGVANITGQANGSNTPDFEDSITFQFFSGSATGGVTIEYEVGNTKAYTNQNTFAKTKSKDSSQGGSTGGSSSYSVDITANVGFDLDGMNAGGSTSTSATNTSNWENNWKNTWGTSTTLDHALTSETSIGKTQTTTYTFSGTLNDDGKYVFEYPKNLSDISQGYTQATVSNGQLLTLSVVSERLQTNTSFTGTWGLSGGFGYLEMDEATAYNTDNAQLTPEAQPWFQRSYDGTLSMQNNNNAAQSIVNYANKAGAGDTGLIGYGNGLIGDIINTNGISSLQLNNGFQTSTSLKNNEIAVLQPTISSSSSNESNATSRSKNSKDSKSLRANKKSAKGIDLSSHQTLENGHGIHYRVDSAKNSPRKISGSGLLDIVDATISQRKHVFKGFTDSIIKSGFGSDRFVIREGESGNSIQSGSGRDHVLASEPASADLGRGNDVYDVISGQNHWVLTGKGSDELIIHNSDASFIVGDFDLLRDRISVAPELDPLKLSINYESYNNETNAYDGYLKIAYDNVEIGRAFIDDRNDVHRIISNDAEFFAHAFANNEFYNLKKAQNYMRGDRDLGSWTESLQDIFVSNGGLRHDYVTGRNWARYSMNKRASIVHEAAEELGDNRSQSTWKKLLNKKTRSGEINAHHLDGPLVDALLGMIESSNGQPLDRTANSRFDSSLGDNQQLFPTIDPVDHSDNILL